MSSSLRVRSTCRRHAGTKRISDVGGWVVAVYVWVLGGRGGRGRHASLGCMSCANPNPNPNPDPDPDPDPIP